MRGIAWAPLLILIVVFGILIAWAVVGQASDQRRVDACAAEGGVLVDTIEWYSDGVCIEAVIIP